MERRKLSIEPYYSGWSVAYEAEADILRTIFRPILVSIHHIGSTAIHTTCAKPIIDILIEVTRITSVDRYNAAMEAHGYEVRGEQGIPGRRYFRKGLPHHTHHVHAFSSGDRNIVRHLAFRDYLNTHPEKGELYGLHKKHLVETDPYNVERYIDGKHELVRQLEREALAWYSQQRDRGTCIARYCHRSLSSRIRETGSGRSSP